MGVESKRGALLLALLLCSVYLTHKAGAIELSTNDISSIQWAPAASGARRALNFDVFLPAFPTARFTDRYRSNFISAFKTSYLDASWTVVTVLKSTKGVTVRTQALFSANPNADWLPSARRVYDMLRTGTCAKVLYPGPWGLSSVQQVAFPYLVSTGHNGYVPGTMVHGLNFNLLLQTRTMEWLTHARATSLLKPLQAMPGTEATNMWKHAYVMPQVASHAAAIVQSASLSVRTLAQINAQVKSDTQGLWPVSVWGPVSLLPGAQILMLGGRIYAPPPPAVRPPPTSSPPPPIPGDSPASPGSISPLSPSIPSSPVSPANPASPSLPSSPSPPGPPLPPDSPVELQFNGVTVGRASGADVPLIIDTDNGPTAVGFVNVSSYPYTGYSHQVVRSDQVLVSLYVGERLVGFVPQWDVFGFTAVFNDYTYAVSQLPMPTPPPIPSDVNVDLVFLAKVLASTSQTTVPVIVNDDDSFEPSGSVDLGDYPYSGFAYEIQRSRQILSSVYVGQRLVGFVPKYSVAGMSAFASGYTYELALLRVKPQPPLPPTVEVALVFADRVIADASNTTVPLVVNTPAGPVSNGTVAFNDYPYSGFAYQMECSGFILSAVYVGQRLVGFMPEPDVSRFSVFVDGQTFEISQPPIKPQPPETPTSDLSLVYRSRLVAVAAIDVVPLILLVDNGPKPDGTVAVKSYPYTGNAYMVERSAQMLVSAYVNDRLVAFVSLDLARRFTGFTAGQTFQVTVPPFGPQPPLPPDAAVKIAEIEGEVLASTEGSNVPVIVNGQDGPIAAGTASADSYPYNGSAYLMEQRGQVLASAYVGERLVAFVPLASAPIFFAFADGDMYDLVVPPSSPSPLPDDVSVNLLYGNQIIAATSSDAVPAIVNGRRGPELSASLNLTNYPYTGKAYQTVQEMQILQSAYVGERLVGFVPQADVALFLAYVQGSVYSLVVLPLPPSPPLPLSSAVSLVYEGKVAASTSADAIPWITGGEDGPATIGSVDPKLFPYTGNAYEIERDMQILVSTYVDQRLVGFVSVSNVSKFSSFANGSTYSLTVPPAAPAPPLPKDATVGLAHGANVISYTEGDKVPVIIVGTSSTPGFALLTTASSADYPWTGTAYEMVQNGQLLISIYVEERLVGFVPEGIIRIFSAFSQGFSYDVTAPPLPSTPPLSPDATVSLMFQGMGVGVASGDAVSVVVLGLHFPVAVSSVSATSYPYTGTSYEIERSGQVVASIFVGKRLVGFVPQRTIAGVLAFADGYSYQVSLPPSPPSPTLPSDAMVSLVFDGRIVATTSGGTGVPLLIEGPTGFLTAGTVDSGKYPWTGSSYQIEQSGQILVSVYIDERLVGFVYIADAAVISAYANGYSYGLSIPPAPPSPDILPTAEVGLVSNGRVIAVSSGSSVPVVIQGSDGPKAIDSVDSNDYPYNGSVYELQRNGQVVASGYIGKRLVGFLSLAIPNSMGAFSNGFSYEIVVPPPAPPTSPENAPESPNEDVSPASPTAVTSPESPTAVTSPEPPTPAFPGIYVWGSNDSGAVMKPSGTSQLSSPASVSYPLADISAGNNFGCGVLVQTLVCWGSNAAGELGRGTTSSEAFPEPAAVDLNGGSFSSVSAGSSHACLTRSIKSGATALCWGYNVHGQLGDDSTVSRSKPVDVAGSDATSYVFIFAGAMHTCGLSSDGSLSCWGFNSDGQLGVGDTADRNVPSLVNNPDRDTVSWVTAAAGSANTCGVTGADAVYCWGSSARGTNGNGSTAGNVLAPGVSAGRFPGLRGLVGKGNTMYLWSSDGSYSVWGDNGNGQCGNGSDSTAISSPVTLSNEKLSTVASGYDFACMLSESRALTCFGHNSSGQLGISDTRDRRVPTPVPAEDGLSWDGIVLGNAAAYGRQRA